MTGLTMAFLPMAARPVRAHEAQAEDQTSPLAAVASSVQSDQAVAPPPIDANHREWRDTARKNMREFFSCGIQSNRVCACCGSAMEPNRPGYNAPNEYCWFCRKEPLCGGCAWGVGGWPMPIDWRWAYLSWLIAARQPTAWPRPTAAG